MSKILIFDTETNGKAKNFKAPMTDLGNWPRVTQLAWMLWDTETDEVRSSSVMVKPDGWTVPVVKFFIDNNMSTERCQDEGIDCSDALDQFITDYNECDVLVAHNIAFDYPVLGADMLRYKKKGSQVARQFCTMKSTTDICCIPGPYGNKWPSLTELHVYLFGKEFKGAHDALDDVVACQACLKELIKRKLVKGF